MVADGIRTLTIEDRFCANTLWRVRSPVHIACGHFLPHTRCARSLVIESKARTIFSRNSTNRSTDDREVISLGAPRAIGVKLNPSTPSGRSAVAACKCKRPYGFSSRSRSTKLKFDERADGAESASKFMDPKNPSGAAAHLFKTAGRYEIHIGELALIRYNSANSLACTEVSKRVEIARKVCDHRFKSRV